MLYLATDFQNGKDGKSAESAHVRLPAQEFMVDKAFGNLHGSLYGPHNRKRVMPSLSEPAVRRRAPRARLREHTPAIIRLLDGRLAQGKLVVVSQTGGLLGLTGLLQAHSTVKIMFVTSEGPVLGTAEMLGQMNSGFQAFQFSSLSQVDRRRLQATVHSSISNMVNEDRWIQKYRAAIDRDQRPRRKGRWTVGVVAMCTLGTAIGLYALHVS